MNDRALMTLAFSALGIVFASAAEAAAVVTFVPGTYELADAYLAAPVDTLVVSVSGGVASFVLSGQDDATFSVPDMSSPAGLTNAPFGANPYFLSASLPSTSWSASTYPYLTFWSTPSAGGLTVGDQPGDQGNNLFDLFQSTQGLAQVYTITGVPEPATWGMMLAGLSLAGAALRGRRRLAAEA